MKTPLPPHPEVKPRPGKSPLVFKGDGWVTIAEACEYWDLDPKRLRGWILRNRLGDPLGSVIDGVQVVYPFSLERYLEARK